LTIPITRVIKVTHLDDCDNIKLISLFVQLAFDIYGSLVQELIGIGYNIQYCRKHAEKNGKGAGTAESIDSDSEPGHWIIPGFDV
jgi:hypothetical protein